MTKRFFWQKPKLHFEEEQNKHRKVTWLELFFDLYFVVVIAAIAHNLSAVISLMGFFKFVLTFIPIWWIWIGVTYYNERFETQGIENRLYILLMMFPIAGMALFSHDATGHNLTGFALSYALARALTLIMWMYATYHNPQFKRAGTKYSIGFSISVLLSLLAGLISHDLGLIIFGVAMTIDLLTPMTAIKDNRDLPRLSTSKLPERYGLFMIIVLGEGVVGTVNAISGVEHLGTGVMYFGILGISLTFALWWLYFDFIGRRTADNSNPLKQFLWAYLHLPIVICFTAMGASLTGLIGEVGDLSESAKTLLIVSCGGALWMMALMEPILKRTSNEPTHPVLSPLLKFITGAGILSIYFVQSEINSKAIMLLILALFTINMIYGLYVWFNQKIETDASKNLMGEGEIDI